MRVEVVVLPLVPVTPTQVHCEKRRKRSVWQGDLHALGHGHVTERNARSFDNEVVILHRVEVAVAAVEGHVAVMQVDIAPVAYAQMLIGQVAADHIVGRAPLPAEAEDEHAPLSEIFNQLPKHIYTSP